MTARDPENEARGLLAASLRYGHVKGRGVFPGSGVGGRPSSLPLWHGRGRSLSGLLDVLGSLAGVLVHGGMRLLVGDLGSLRREVLVTL